MKIGNRYIGEDSATFIIAEAGVNHNGSIDIAKELIDAAATAGADAVKFQTFNSEKLASKFVQQAKYQKENTGIEESQVEMLKRLELSYKDHILLKRYCEKKGIEFLSTPFDIDSAKFLKGLGVDAFKIGSGDLNNIPYLIELDKLGLPVLLSTGMSNLSEIEESVSVLKESDFALLHCTSNYPTPYEDVNLKAIQSLKRVFLKIVGYSDHTNGIEISIAAVTLGAKIIEKHFTLDRSMPGPDHKASLEPNELKKLVESIRNTEKSLGDGIKRCMPSEIATREVARKSLVVTKDLEPGDILTDDTVTIKRPGNGLEPKYYSIIKGKSIKRSIKKDEVIQWNDVLC
ncbi:MAG: N-acetylneuraminate synthase [Bacillota bacterium]|nr:N-acetylneuraminate synthase [Bacillota bacterium]